MKNWKKLLLITIIGIISSVNILKGQDTIPEIYNKDKKVFIVEPFVIHDMYTKKAYVKVLEKENKFRTQRIDSLLEDLSIDVDIINALRGIVKAHKSEIIELNNKVSTTLSLYNNCLLIEVESDKVMKEQRKEIISLKRKNLFNSIMDFGIGVFKLKYLTVFITGYTIGSLANK